MLLTSDIDRSGYWPKLSDYVNKVGAGKYKKNRVDMYQVLRPYLDEAIRNARWLDESYGDIPPSLKAPDTKVYILMNKLRPYL